MSTPILIAYDGSPDARHAIEKTARLFPGASAVVLYARQPLESLAAHLEGHPALEELRDIDASLIVLGSRGRHGVRAVLSGSTSTRVMHSTGRPTLVIPSTPLAAARRTDR
ncbi:MULTISPECIES: universal stress protein [unclassified Nonomuraea]|uniref:universal stress protein n=1 Tax=unclassified Nonomuraea TaxID=2593643 RepID=UPI00340FD767